ncbi:MAG: hypothetical protein ACKOBC_10275 [Hyphomicrobiales bacterium]
MTTLSDHTNSDSHTMRGLTATHRVMIGIVVGITLLVGAGFWAYRGSVVFTELVDLALAYCF